MIIPDPDLDFLPISDPGVKKAPDPGSGSATLVKISEFTQNSRALKWEVVQRRPVLKSSLILIGPCIPAGTGQTS